MNRARLVAALVGLVALAVAARTLPLATWVVQAVDLIRSTGVRGYALYVAIYTLSTVALVPGSILTMLAGFVWGPVYGLFAALPASLAGATLAFLLGRGVLRSWVLQRMASSPRGLAVDRAVGRQGFTIVMLLRLSPLVPFNVLNYALSLTGMPVRRFVAASAIGMLPGCWLYVYLGSLVTTAAQLSTAGSTDTPWKTVMYLAGFAATLAAAVVTGRLAKRALAAEPPTTSDHASEEGRS